GGFGERSTHPRGERSQPAAEGREAAAPVPNAGPAGPPPSRAAFPRVSPGTPGRHGITSPPSPTPASPAPAVRDP
ncbi:hypothetical protein PV779_12760, partial [Streptomyces sp. ID01-9D]|nr:hypothetical protein [Streptomyces sp. ID01-9D]